MRVGSAIKISSETSATYDERQLVAQVLSQDSKATAEFVGFCSDSVYSFVRKRLIPRVEMVAVRDAFQPSGSFKKLWPFCGQRDHKSPPLATNSSTSKESLRVSSQELSCCFLFPLQQVATDVAIQVGVFSIFKPGFDSR